MQVKALGPDVAIMIIDTCSITLRIITFIDLFCQKRNLS